MITYSGSAASRERRVRRTRRPSKEERWQRSSEPAGYSRMSAFCTFDSISLEESISVLTGFSSFSERVSITSYTDVVHARFTSAPRLTSSVDTKAPSSPRTPASDGRECRDAFLFPYGAAILWGFTSMEVLPPPPALESLLYPSPFPPLTPPLQELEFLSQLQPCCAPLTLATGHEPDEFTEDLGDSEFMLFELDEPQPSRTRARTRA